MTIRKKTEEEYDINIDTNDFFREQKLFVLIFIIISLIIFAFIFYSFLFIENNFSNNNNYQNKNYSASKPILKKISTDHIQLKNWYE